MDGKTTIKLNGEENSWKTENKPARKRRNPFLETKEDKERRQKKRARLIVRNINYKCKEEDLKSHFSQWGTVEEVNLLKRPDGKLVGCAFIQYEAINQAAKAILKGNNQELKGRAVFVDWAIGKDDYTAQKGSGTTKLKVEKPKVKEEESKAKEEKTKVKTNEGDSEESEEENDSEEEVAAKKIKFNQEDSDDDDEDEERSEEDDDEEDLQEEGSDDENTDSEDKKDLKLKLNSEIQKEKHISNDVTEGCTVFIKNVPFDVEDNDLRKLCRKYGPLYYVIINRDKISGHSKGTAFVKFKSKESADLCLQAGTDLVLMDQVMEPFPALSRAEIANQANSKSKDKDAKDSRNLYLAREGLIMSGSKAAEGVSASDMQKRHKLEKTKTEVLKNLNRFVSRNRLSVHNLPLSYDNEKLRQMAITYTGFKPHECRVMRENKITAEHPQGKSKGFGFLSFNTHQEALAALRKLNNNPHIFSNQHRPIVAFSIEDRAVHKIKENRALKSKLNNPTYKDKLEKRKAARKEKLNGRLPKPKGPQNDNKAKLQKHIKKLEEQRAKAKNPKPDDEEVESYVGTAAKPGQSLRMRSNKKINEQAQEHKKRVRENKKKLKQQKIRQTHLAERKAEIRPKQGKKVERDDLERLVNKYKNMINIGSSQKSDASNSKSLKQPKPKRTKWFKED